MPEVRSSHIKHLEHEGDALKVTFTSGKVYKFEGVKRELYEAFLQAPSKGTFFHKWIEKRGQVKRKFEVLNP